MPFQKGEIANPNGAGKNTVARRSFNKMQHALDKAIDLLGVGTVHKCGSTALAELLVPKLREDPVGTIKALSCLFPKDIAIGVTHSNQAKLLTDDELAERIATLTRQAALDHQDSNTIDIDSSEIETVKESKG